MHEVARFPRPFGKYLLLRQLAVGGMAEVYLARQSGPAGFEKECVIKRILPSLAADQQFVQMFLDEARIAARLSHPNIVQIFDLGKIGDQDFFLAMEHVHGVDLEQVIAAERARAGHVPLAVSLRLVSNVAEGLEHAHRATDARGAALGIVHRDVTPSNVIVSMDGVAKILDFGIAKAVAKKGRTEVGVIKGKIPYMSPEQVQGEVLDARSDVFSLGTILYEVTVGKKTFDGENPAQLSMQILHEEPPPPLTVVPHYPESLARIVARAMAKRPQDRYASARELQLDIETFLAANRIACTSHDVSQYLEALFPDLKARFIDDGQPNLPVEVTDPTVPMQMMEKMHSREQATVQHRSYGDEGPSGPVTGNLDGVDLESYEERRRSFGGGGGGKGTFVIVGLVLAVAVGFWWLHGYVLKKEVAAEAAGQTAPSLPAAAKPSPPHAAAAPAAARAEPLAAKADPAPPAKVEPLRGETPSVKAEPAPPKAEPAAPKPEPKVRRPAVHRAHAEPGRALPRLPGPPPPDDAP